MKTTDKCVFDFGDRVTSKKLGLPTIGNIFGIMAARNCASLYPAEAWRMWDHHYPDWREKFVYSVMFDSPQAPLSREEAITLYPNSNCEDYANLPKFHWGWYPEDDLETF